MKSLVTFSDFMISPDGGQVRAAYGQCRVVRSDSLVGGPVGRSHAPWSLIIEGACGRLYVPGCKVDFVLSLQKPPKQCPSDHDGAPFLIWFADGEASS